MSKPKFIVFEGVDASGKSTISQMLFDHLHKSGINIYKTFEPTDSPIGSVLRNILNKRIAADEKTIGALFLADRIDHLTNPVNGLLSYLEKGVNIISDRYYYSSYAYHVPHLSMDWIINANKVCADMLRPDIVFYMDVSIDVSMQRLNANRKFHDLFETRDRINNVISNYKEAISREGLKDNVVVINAERTIPEIFEEVLAMTLQILRD